MHLAAVHPVTRRPVAKGRSEHEVIGPVAVNIAGGDAAAQLISGVNAVNSELLVTHRGVSALTRLERSKKDVRFAGVWTVIYRSVGEGGGERDIRHTVAVKIAAGDGARVIAGVRAVQNSATLKLQHLRGGRLGTRRSLWDWWCCPPLRFVTRAGDAGE